MRIYFSTNEKYYSKAARYIANEPFTHISLGFFTGSINLVVECTKPVGSVYHFDYWCQKNDVCEVLELNFDFSDEMYLYELCVQGCVNVPYDWGAYYFAWIAALKKYFFKIPYPRKNKWATDGKWCTEVLDPIANELYNLGYDIVDIDLEVTTPYMMFLFLKDMPGVLSVTNEYFQN